MAVHPQINHHPDCICERLFEVEKERLKLLQEVTVLQERIEYLEQMLQSYLEHETEEEWKEEEILRQISVAA